MARNTDKLSKRQIEVLTCIYMRQHQYTKAYPLNLIGDMGISGSTLADHLNALARLGYVEESPYGSYRHRNVDVPLVLTERGKKRIKEIMSNFNIDINEPQIRGLKKVRDKFPHSSQEHNFRQERKSDFSKAFNELITKNPTEPVISSVGMYTELDSQLALMSLSPNPSERENYLSLSRTKLNLPIRNGRIASIIIPLALRNETSILHLTRSLENGWHWFRTVNTNTINRYFEESSSMGLIDYKQGTITTMKPGATGTIAWLSEKTLPTFINSVPNIPKASILVFRESFHYPTYDELLNPNNASVDVPWADYIYGCMSNKNSYQEIMTSALDVMVRQAKIIVEDKESGRLIPQTIIRRLKEASDINEAFHRLLKLANEQNPTAILLLTIIAHPGITSDRLHIMLTKEDWIFFRKSELDDAIRQLISLGLIHTAGGRTAKLYAFTQIPYVVQSSETSKNEINAVLKGLNTSLITRIGDMMTTVEEKNAFHRSLSQLLKHKSLDYDAIEAEYGKAFSRKFIMLSDMLQPFAQIMPDAQGIFVSKEELSSLVLDVAQYSLLTSNDALNEYATLLSDIVRKDQSFKSKLIESSVSVKDSFIQRGLDM